MDINTFIGAYDQFTRLRKQLDISPEKWTPKCLEEWHDAVQEALVGIDSSGKVLNMFNSIPLGQRKTFAIVRDDECSVCGNHYSPSDVEVFLKKEIGEFKDFLDSVISPFDEYIEAHYDEYLAAVKSRIEKIIEQGHK